jgi:hypothetical protein
MKAIINSSSIVIPSSIHNYAFIIHISIKFNIDITLILCFGAVFDRSLKEYEKIR